MNATPTEWLQKPMQTLLDLGVERSTTATALCRELEGKSFALVTGNPALDRYFEVQEGRLLLKPGRPGEASATLQATPLTLLRMLGEDPQPIIRVGDARVSGDTQVAEDFQALLKLVRPDLEEELSKLTGDAIAHEAGNAVRGIAGWLRGVRQSLGRSASEYLREESRDLITRTELDEFCAGVDGTARAVDRAEARLRLIREARKSS